jgi:hypothetical protein
MNRLKNLSRRIMHYGIRKPSPLARHVATRVLLLGFEFPPESKQDELLETIRIRSRGQMGDDNGFRTPKKKYSSNYIPEAFFDPVIPTIYDYHIVVVSKEAILYGRDFLSSKKDDFASLMWAAFPGTLIVPIIGGNANYESWVPTMDRLKERSGDSFKLRAKHWAFSFMKKYEKRFTWRAHADYSIASYDDEIAKRIIATNITDNPIAFESSLGNGRTIFLPFYSFDTDEEESSFLRNLIDSIEQRYKSSKEKVVPSWASKPSYRFPSEEDVDKQVRALEQERSILVRMRSILWLDGVELVNSVAETLTWLGVQCEVKETEGRHDIEIREQVLHGIMEVKGLSGYANLDGIRQLLDWYGEAIKEDSDVKGIFLVNDFREIEPDLRQSKMIETVKDGHYPFTKEAERIAANNDFCLLTTYQLFNLVKLKMSGKLDKSDFLGRLKNTKGVFRLDEQ